MKILDSVFDKFSNISLKLLNRGNKNIVDESINYAHNIVNKGEYDKYEIRNSFLIWGFVYNRFLSILFGNKYSGIKVDYLIESCIQHPFLFLIKNWGIGVIQSLAFSLMIIIPLSILGYVSSGSTGALVGVSVGSKVTEITKAVYYILGLIYAILTYHRATLLQIKDEIKKPEPTPVGA